jgi:hypothetical protein
MPSAELCRADQYFHLRCGRIDPAMRHNQSNFRRANDLIAAGKSWTFISAALRRDMNSVRLHAKALRLVGQKKNED